MTREEFIQVHGALCEELKDITARKNADYTGAGDGPFHNFVNVEQLGICTTEQGFLTRMTDKMARIASLTKTGKQMVKDESIEDTLKDLANYSLLMVCYLRSKKEVPLIADTEYFKYRTTNIGVLADEILTSENDFHARLEYLNGK